MSAEKESKKNHFKQDGDSAGNTVTHTHTHHTVEYRDTQCTCLQYHRSALCRLYRLREMCMPLPSPPPLSVFMNLSGALEMDNQIMHSSQNLNIKLQNIEMKQKTSRITCSFRQTTHIFLIWWILLHDLRWLHPYTHKQWQFLTTYDVDASFRVRSSRASRENIVLRLDQMEASIWMEETTCHCVHLYLLRFAAAEKV